MCIVDDDTVATNETLYDDYRALWGIIEICKALLFSVNKRISNGPEAGSHVRLHETPAFIYNLSSDFLVLLGRLDCSRIPILQLDAATIHGVYEEKMELRCTFATYREHQLFIDHLVHKWVLNNLIWENKKPTPTEANKDHHHPPSAVTISGLIPSKSHLLFVVPYCMEVIMCL